MAGEHYVLGLEVPVHDLTSMAVCHSRQQLSHIPLGLILRYSPLLHNPFKQLAATTILHHNVDEGLLDVNLVDADYVRVVLF